MMEDGHLKNSVQAAIYLEMRLERTIYWGII